MQQQNSIRWENDLRKFQYHNVRRRRMADQKKDEIKSYKMNVLMDKTVQEQRRNQPIFSSKAQALDAYLVDFLQDNHDNKESSKENKFHSMNYGYDPSPKATQLRMSLMKSPLHVQVDPVGTTILPSQRHSSTSPLTKIKLQREKLRNKRQDTNTSTTSSMKATSLKESNAKMEVSPSTRLLKSLQKGRKELKMLRSVDYNQPEEQSITPQSFSSYLLCRPEDFMKRNSIDLEEKPLEEAPTPHIKPKIPLISPEALTISSMGAGVPDTNEESTKPSESIDSSRKQIDIELAAHKIQRMWKLRYSKVKIKEHAPVETSTDTSTVQDDQAVKLQLDSISFDQLKSLLEQMVQEKFERKSKDSVASTTACIVVETEEEEDLLDESTEIVPTLEEEEDEKFQEDDEVVTAHDETGSRSWLLIDEEVVLLEEGLYIPSKSKCPDVKEEYDNLMLFNTRLLLARRDAADAQRTRHSKVSEPVVSEEEVLEVKAPCSLELPFLSQWSRRVRKNRKTHRNIILHRLFMDVRKQRRHACLTAAGAYSPASAAMSAIGFTSSQPLEGKTIEVQDKEMLDDLEDEGVFTCPLDHIETASVHTAGSYVVEDTVMPIDTNISEDGVMTSSPPHPIEEEELIVAETVESKRKDTALVDESWQCVVFESPTMNEQDVNVRNDLICVGDLLYCSTLTRDISIHIATLTIPESVPLINLSPKSHEFTEEGEKKEELEDQAQVEDHKSILESPSENFVPLAMMLQPEEESSESPMKMEDQTPLIYHEETNSAHTSAVKREHQQVAEKEDQKEEEVPEDEEEVEVEDEKEEVVEEEAEDVNGLEMSELSSCCSSCCCEDPMRDYDAVSTGISPIPNSTTSSHSSSQSIPTARVFPKITSGTSLWLNNPKEPTLFMKPMLPLKQREEFVSAFKELQASIHSLRQPEEEEEEEGKTEDIPIEEDEDAEELRQMVEEILTQEKHVQKAIGNFDDSFSSSSSSSGASSPYDAQSPQVEEKIQPNPIHHGGLPRHLWSSPFAFNRTKEFQPSLHHSNTSTITGNTIDIGSSKSNPN